MDRIAEILALLATPGDLSGDQLVDLEAELLSLFEDVRAAEVTDQSIADLTGIRDGLATARTEQAARQEAADELAAQADALAAEIAPEPEPEPEVVPEPVAEVTPTEPAPEPDPEPVDPPAAEDIAPAVEPEPVAAAAPRTTPVADLARRVPPNQRPRVPAQARSNTTVTQAIQAAGHEAGRELRTPDEAKAVLADAIKRFSGRGEGTVQVIHMANEQPPSRRIETEQSANAIIAAAQAEQVEKFPTAEAIIAAGGVCGPAQPYYEQMSVGIDARPVRDALLGFQAPRGAITFVPPPELVDIGVTGGSPNQAVGIVTNSEDASNTTKVHEYFTCGSPTTVTVDTLTNITEWGNLMARTAQEQVAALLHEVGKAFARMAEGNLLAKIDTASVATTGKSDDDLGAARGLLRSWARAAEGMRYRARAPFATIQMLAPYTALQLIANDLTAGAYGPEDVDNFGVTQAQIEQWLATRNIAPTWIYDPATSGAPFYTAQAVGPLRGWQLTMKARFFFPGSFGFLDGGTLDLGIVRDSTLNAANKFQMQMEAFENVIAIGPESLVHTETVCPSGASITALSGADICADTGS